MKRSTLMAITTIVGLTVLLLVYKIIYPDSSKETIRTVMAGKEWLNMEFGADRIQLKGNTTLVVFWNYTDITGKKSLKKAAEWKGKYGSMLQLVGIHSPEFSFEKEISNIKKSVEEQKIKFPVLLDNNAEQKWTFKNEAIPSLHIVNKEGKIVFSHSGDGEYDVTETAIREVLSKAGFAAKLPEFIKTPISGVCFATTPDLYLNTVKGVVANKEGPVSEKAHNYKPVKEIPEDSLALIGKYKAEKECLNSVGQGAGFSLNFTATEVNLVAQAMSDEAVLEVLLNGKAIKKESRGKNLDDKNQVKLKGPALYQLIKNKNKPEKGILTIKSVKGDFKLYAIRFYGCSE